MFYNACAFWPKKSTTQTMFWWFVFSMDYCGCNILYICWFSLMEYFVKSWDSCNDNFPTVKIHFYFGLNSWIRSVQLISHVQFFATPWTTAPRASLSITNSRSLLNLKSIESVMPSNYFILCHPLLLPSSIFPSIRVFSNESVLHIRWSKCWSFSFSISPSNEYSGLISFRIDWFDLLAVLNREYK